MRDDSGNPPDHPGAGPDRPNEHGDGRLRIDSRGWTGRALGPTRAERRAAWKVFQSVTGPTAVAPRRASAIACAIGGVLVPPAIAVIAPDRLPWLAARLKVTAAGVGDLGTASLVMRWLAAFVGPALAIGLAGAIAGAASAYRNRAALARGFVTPSADRLERGGADVVIAFMAFALMFRQSWRPTIGAVPPLWVLSYFLARGMTLMAERLFAAPGERRRMAINTPLAMLAIIVLLIASTCR